MPASIVLTGLAATDPVPGNYIEVNFAVGESAGFQGARPALLIGNKTSAGDATNGTVVYGPNTSLPIQTEADVIARFGTGSELHRMWRRFTKVNKETAVYAISVADPGGTAATLVITFATTAAAAGSVRCWVGDEYVDVAIASGDTVTTIAAAVKTAINAKTHWPVTANNSSGVLTITARQTGPRGNDLRGNAIIYGTGVATTSDVTSPTAFTTGATPDDNTTALATIAASQYYYIVSAAYDSTQLGALVTQVGTQAQPITGIRQRVFAGHTGTPANANTLASGRNSARLELIHLQNADWTPAELAANAAAVYALYELPAKPRHNFSGFGGDAKTQASWVVPAPRVGTVPTRANIKLMLETGTTPIAVNNLTNATYLTKRITSRCLNGSTADYRIRDAHRVTECDFFADDLLSKLSNNFSGRDLGNDLAPGQKPSDPDLVTPALIKSAILRLIDDYAENSRVKNVATIKANTVVQRSSSNTNRVEIRVPMEIIDILDQTATDISQVG